MEDSLVDSEIIHSGEGGDIKWWLEPRNKFLVFAIAFVLLFIAYHYSCVVVCLAYHYCFYFILHFHYRSLLISTRRQLSISIYNLEELRGEDRQPFMGNSTLILILSDRFASFIISSF